ncbi:MAG: GcvT family protein [Acidimicrobiia bacterium]|nr:GcvT family protein [Actinomycetota bacterium]MBL6924627.1 GcvT family protein [Acidimicrobiia bacterium]MBL6925942.1 GcvT family protein [Acidimicrobiia bacterium]
MRSEAQCVIVGGGAMGVGLLYHLAHEGWTDTLLVEKGELTSGSTWHAAGLVPNFIGSLNMAKVHAYGIDLYKALEAETGMSTGWHGCGAIRLAVTEEQADWYRYVQGILGSLGVESHLISPDDVRQRVPLMESTDDIILGFWTPNDGWSDPTGSTNAMAVGARQLGAEIARHTLVTAVDQLPDGRWKVTTDKGEVTCDHVVNAAGHYAPQLGAMSGIDVPIVSMIHQYLITESLPEIAAQEVEMPVIRDPRSSCYYRREIDSLLIGPYETRNSITYGVDGIDWNLHFHLTPPDLDQLAPWLEISAERFPLFAEAGIKQVVSGPITHTPDGGYLMGPAPGVRNYWMCAGASIGITQGPGAGKFLAQWMVHGQTEINVREMDPRRFGPWSDLDYTIAKSVDEYHEMYQVRMPGEYRSAGRPLRRTPIAERLDALGAQWQDVWGWERARYYGPPEEYSWRRSNAFDAVGDECRGVRERVGISDLSAFAKFGVVGRDAAALLGRLSANRLPARPGGIRLVHMLTDMGGIECEMTVTRMNDERFYLNSAIAGTTHDIDWLTQHVLPNEDVTVENWTDQMGILAVTGPLARDVLASCSDADLSNEAFPWLTCGQVEIGGVGCIALRVSYVGELGWELHHPIEQMPQLYEALIDAGEPHGMVHFGAIAMNSMRMEKAYKAWGGELTTEITPIEAGLDRFVDLDTPGRDFMGRGATIARRDTAGTNRSGLDMLLAYCEVDTTDSDCRGNEPVYQAGTGNIIGITTGGAWGHTVKQSLAFAYVEPAFAAPGTTFEIGLFGERHTATVLDQPAHDPTNERLKA